MCAANEAPCFLPSPRYRDGINDDDNEKHIPNYQRQIRLDSFSRVQIGEIHASNKLSTKLIASKSINSKTLLDAKGTIIATILFPRESRKIFTRPTLSLTEYAKISLRVFKALPRVARVSPDRPVKT